MENEILFRERQRFNQWWLWLMLIGINGLTLYGVIIQVFGGQKFGNNPASNITLLIIFGLTIALTLLFTTFQLDTLIKQDGIHFRFFPFHLSFKHFDWNEINRIYVRKYNPILEYGGWGLRYGLWGKGRAYNVSGNRGMQIEFINNKKILIGTNKPDELDEVLYKIGKIKHKSNI